jgi:hypothetical protein
MTAVFATQIEIDTQGVAWLSGTTTKVLEIVLDKVAHDWNSEEIRFQHAHLSMAQIHAAFTRYYENEAHADAEIRGRMENAAALAAQSSDPEFRRKLIELKRSL